MSSEAKIDESLYSRQLYVMGHAAQSRMAMSSVLIAGLNGLGVEAAKNVILMGVKNVALYDSKDTEWKDLSAQFFLNETNIGQNRAAASVNKLSELNPYVNVTLVTGSLLDAVSTKAYNVVVLIDQPHELQLIISDFCHMNHIKFIIGDVIGVFGQIFCDFGEEFVVNDVNGEPEASSMIASISHDVKAVVTTLEETRHGLSTGDLVILTDISGMIELNNRTFRVEVKDPFNFEIDVDTRGYSPYITGGYVNQIKQPTTVSFKSFRECLYHSLSYEEVLSDAAKFNYNIATHYAFQALHQFASAHQGQYPAPGDQQQAQEFLTFISQIHTQKVDFSTSHQNSQSASFQVTLSQEDFEKFMEDKFFLRFALCSQGVINPVSGFLGGVLGQEIVKACSGKFMPIKQFFYFDAVECLTDEILSKEEVTPRGCRYDGQAIVFGHTLQQKLSTLKMFLVGAGAIGCEMLKNWAMMGVACGSEGMVHVTDMDRIEKSNLSRQFLFRNTDINKAKSTTATLMIMNTMNGDFRSTAYEQKVGFETEDIFNDDFFEPLDFVCTALDNVQARLYVDGRCLYYRKPMLESGTLGAKGHTQIVCPGLTEHYGARRDPTEKSIPVCTLKYFPNQIEHTLQWGRDWFEEIFNQTPDDVNRYIYKPSEFFQQLENQPNMRLDTLQRVKEALVDKLPRTFDDCLVYARKVFEEHFVNQIKQLLVTFPLDHVTGNGTLFWSGSKKPPCPLEFDSADSAHMSFILSVAKLRAMVYNLPIPYTEHEEQLIGHTQTLLSTVQLAPFQAVTGLKIAATEEELKAQAEAQKQRESSSISELEALCTQIMSALPASMTLQEQRVMLQTIEFDKDIDSHMLVVAATSNLRARNYRIPETDLHISRGIAGKIIPAIATTTAMVTGAICLELLKVLQGKTREQLQNYFANLAVPIFTSETPEPPKSTTAIVKGSVAAAEGVSSKEWKWTQWDRIEINDQPNMTVTQLIDYLNDKYGFELSMLSSGVTILFSDFMDPRKSKERRGMTLAKLVETVTKKTIPPSQRFMIFEVIVNDAETGDEVEVPYIRYRLHR